MDRKWTVVILLFEWLSQRAFCDVLCPSSCYCNDNNEYVSCVGDGQWGGLPNLPNTSIRLELSNYDVRVLSFEFLDGLELLEELKLQQLRLVHIEDRTFMKLNKLLTLDLSQNSLVNITSNAFQGLSNLRHLDLSSNLLLCVEKAFTSVSKVEQLNLKSNQLFSLTTHTFIGLTNVRYLNIDDNRIANIDMGTFQNLKNLAHLILSNNPLVILSRLDFLSPRLQYMDISRAALEKVPTNLSKFVRDLRLANNNITVVKKGDFDNYPYVGLVVLDDNMITNIEDGTWGRHEYLQRIWLNGNRLVKIPFNLPTSVKALYLEENFIPTILNDSFPGLINLEQLFLQRNKIQNISVCGFCGLRRLNILDLQANFIQTISDGIFSNLTSLQMLDLSQNDIQQMDGNCFLGLRNLLKLHISRISNDIQFKDNIFDHLKNLETLEMYDISKLARRVLNSTHALHKLQNLKMLNIMHNEITELREDFPSFFPYLEILKISENIWDCKSGILWLSRWIKTAPSIFADAQSITCATPPMLEKTPLISLNEDYFNTEPYLASTKSSQGSKLYEDSYEAVSSKMHTKQFSINKMSTLHYETYKTSLETTPIINNNYIVTHVNEIELNPTENISETKTFTFWEYQLSDPPLIKRMKTAQSTPQLQITTTETSSINTESKTTLNASKINWINMIIIISSSVSVCLLIIVAILIGIAMYRRNKKHQNNLCNTCSSSSITYCPYRDEVLTAFDKTNDASTCQGITNEVYNIIDNA